jgi:alanine dehydrogenase
MLVGVPKEIKNNEFRVGLTPAGARELVNAGHRVLIQNNAGAEVGLSDAMYLDAGAELVPTAQDIFGNAELVVKVKEPQPVECKMLRPEQVLFTYLHLAPDPVQTRLLIESGATCIAYETVTDRTGALPLLAPMSEVAGRMSVHQAAACLEKSKHGSGTLLAGVPGVEPAHVLVIGGGVVGINAARLAAGLGARVTVVDRSLPRLRYIDELYGDRITTLYSTSKTIEEKLPTTDAVIGAVLIPGAAAPQLVTRAMLKLMRPGSVMVDVAIDQGGCFETSKATTHEDPTYEVDNIVHYCVANMPGAVARTSTFALTNATLPYVLRLANEGWRKALASDPGFLAGLNVHAGKVTFRAVSEALGYSYHPAQLVVGA